jgi:hypothetical protein
MNLNISKKMIRRISHEDTRKKEICAKFFPHRLTSEQKQRRLVSRQDFTQACQDNPSFLDWVFLFPKAKTAFKAKNFQDVEDIEKNVRPK